MTHPLGEAPRQLFSPLAALPTQDAPQPRAEPAVGDSASLALGPDRSQGAAEEPWHARIGVVLRRLARSALNARRSSRAPTSLT